MKPNKLLSYTWLAVGGVLCAAGLAFMGMYLFGAVIEYWDGPDRSPLFWYLPILFIGIFGLVLGVGVVSWGISGLRRLRQTAPPEV